MMNTLGIVKEAYVDSWMRRILEEDTSMEENRNLSEKSLFEGAPTIHGMQVGC